MTAAPNGLLLSIRVAEAQHISARPYLRSDRQDGAASHQHCASCIAVKKKSEWKEEGRISRLKKRIHSPDNPQIAGGSGIELAC